MTLCIRPELWIQLCTLAKRYPTARFVLDQHEGQIVRIEVWQDKETRLFSFPKKEEALQVGSASKTLLR